MHIWIINSCSIVLCLVLSLFGINPTLSVTSTIQDTCRLSLLKLLTKVDSQIGNELSMRPKRNFVEPNAIVNKHNKLLKLTFLCELQEIINCDMISTEPNQIIFIDMSQSIPSIVDSIEDWTDLVKRSGIVTWTWGIDAISTQAGRIGDNWRLVDRLSWRLASYSRWILIAKMAICIVQCHCLNVGLLERGDL